MKKFFTALINFYQKAFSPDQGFLPRALGIARPACIFYPTCSEYAKQAIQIHGPWKGARLALLRIGRCNPLHAPGVDLVPDKKNT